jgi:glycosyltransferase involved in cell wall biosynthesis
VDDAPPRLLWVPHTAWAHCPAQRPWFLARALAGRFEVHVATWASRPVGDPSARAYYLNPWNHLRATRTRTERDGAIRVHHLGLPLPVAQGLWRSYPPGWLTAAIGTLFRARVRRLHRRYRFAAAVVCPSHHLTGFPPRLPDAPTVFDYVDLYPEEVEAGYVAAADRVVTVSHTLADRIRKVYGRDAAVIPNGLHLDRFRRADRTRGRARWGLEGKTVVSLIGLTCSARLYFLDALARLLPEFPGLVFVAAGHGRIAGVIAARCRDLGLPHLLTGWVDPAEVPDLFAASDIGLYPGDDISYYDGACPLKVLEYTGARVPVVVNRSEELIRLGFPSVVVRPATVEGFEDGLRQVLRARPDRFPDMAGYDWAVLARRFGDEVEALIARAPTAARP